MPSQLKSDTARSNGAKSRGPTTSAGREKSSQNAVTHGLTSRSAIVLDCESQEEFDKILNNFLVTYNPVDAAEKDLVEEMVACRWRIRRLWGIETSLLDAEVLNQKCQSPAGGPRLNLANAFRALADNSRSLALAHRYESRLHRIYGQAYTTLRELQQRRDPLPPAALTPIAPDALEPDMPPEPPPAPSGSGPQQELRNEPTGAATTALSENPKTQPTPTPAPRPTDVWPVISKIQDPALPAAPEMRILDVR